MAVALTLLAIVSHPVDKLQDGRHPSLHLVHARPMWVMVFRTRAPATFTTDAVEPSVHARKWRGTTGRIA